MGAVHAEIELINAEDIGLARRHFIESDAVRKITVVALVDSGSYMLAINENIQEYLQLPVIDKGRAQLANGEIFSYDIVGPVELHFKNRQTICRALVLPGDAEVLLGSIPLEDMDVLIDPLRQQLIIHPERPDMAQVRL